jgi:hypothetical protein
MALFHSVLMITTKASSGAGMPLFNDLFPLVAIIQLGHFFRYSNDKYIYQPENLYLF